MLLEGDIPASYRVWCREDGSPWRLGGGRAYRATDVRTDEPVVLRFFDAPPAGPADTAALARLAQTLSHPGSTRVPPLRDLFIRERTHLAVVEFVAGCSLAESVQTHGVMTGEQVRTLAHDALEALAVLHDAGVAHGNLGPSKLLFTVPDGTLALVDGGLHAGGAIPAPPQGNAATADDLRRLGITLWFALTGRLPFPQGLAAPDGAVPAWAQLDVLPTSPALRMLTALFTRTLTGGDAPRRPRHAADLLAALGFQPRLVARLPPREPTSTDRRRDPEESPATPPSPVSPVQTLRAPSSRLDQPRSVGRTAAMLVLLVLAGGLAMAAWEQRSSPGRVVSPGPSSPPPSAPKIAVSPAPAPDGGASTPALVAPAFPPLEGGPPVNAAGLQARAAGIQLARPDAFEALKLARELRRIGTLPVPDGRRFPTPEDVARIRAALASANSASPSSRRTSLVLVLGYSDESAADVAAAGSQDEADALAGALFHDGITAPVYACGLGNPAGMPGIDTDSAGTGGFVEIWAAFLLF